jgi:hypothetical protein
MGTKATKNPLRSMRSFAVGVSGTEAGNHILRLFIGNAGHGRWRGSVRRSSGKLASGGSFAIVEFCNNDVLNRFDTACLAMAIHDGGPGATLAAACSYAASTHLRNKRYASCVDTSAICGKE